MGFRMILHPTDFSECSEYAFQFACSLARAHGARLILLHVVEPPAVVPGEVVSGLAVKADKETATQRLARLKPPDPKVLFEHELEEGDPAEQILHAAKINTCDLIVIGTHGRTGLGRVLMGSVAEQVMRKAPCPVLTVKVPLPEASSAAEPTQQTAEATA